MEKAITMLDGSIEQQTKDLKEFLGLNQEQTFEDLEIEEESQ